MPTNKRTTQPAAKSIMDKETGAASRAAAPEARASGVKTKEGTLVTLLLTGKSDEDKTRAERSAEIPGRCQAYRATIQVGFYRELRLSRNMRTAKLIIERNRGPFTPVECFIDALINKYKERDANGEGITIQDVEDELKLLREDMVDAVEHAHFLVGRYPLEEPSTPAALTEEPETAPVR